MGDRVLIQVINGASVSPVCYGHWAGEYAPRYIREVAELMKGRNGDVEYTFARLVGVLTRYNNGNTGVGVWNQTTKLTPEDSHGDAGCYVIDCNNWDVEAFGGYGTPFNARQ